MVRKMCVENTILVIKYKAGPYRAFSRAPYRNGSHCCGGGSGLAEIWNARGLLARADTPLDSLRQADTPLDSLPQADTPVDPLFRVLLKWKNLERERGFLI